MPYASALSTAPQAVQALDEACLAVARVLDGPPDLAVAFFSPHHLGAAPALARGLTERLAPAVLLGCVAETVIGTGREVEDGPALSLWAARWSRAVGVTPFHLTLEETADGPSLLGWPDALTDRTPPPPAPPGAGPLASGESILLLGDPFSFPADQFLERLAEQAPGLPVLGGMASGIRAPGQCRLLTAGGTFSAGASGVLLRGVRVRSVVSQGCRPVGRPFVITRSEGNVIRELGGKSPLEQLRGLWEELSPDEQQLFRAGPHLGLVIDEYRDTFRRGDFLIRNLVGLDATTGYLVVGDRVRTGQTVQFHVRDAASASEDLAELLGQSTDPAPAAGLLFSCNGRGSRLFAAPDHDAGTVARAFGPVPLAGLFAMGELGPVGGQNFVHGFTASLALFDE